MGLAAVLWRFLADHEPCIAAHSAVPRLDTVTTVPSTSGRTDHPLRTMAASMVGVTRDRYQYLLTPTPQAADLGRAASATRYESTGLWGDNVLLIEDTWTTGNQRPVRGRRTEGRGRTLRGRRRARPPPQPLVP
ncbi:hypothetical protein OG338_11745 [Streptomyces sp. NBC_00726]|uniref:hypothetical protein n=1 Tax=Streptomyces sp. NBC_00726 TaxID=2903674 RepID=UPI00386EC41A